MPQKKKKPRPPAFAWNNISYSKLSAFISCPLRGFWEYVMYEKAMEFPLTVFGQTIHYLFSRFLIKHPSTKRFPYASLDKLLATYKGFWWGAVKQEHGFDGWKTPLTEVAWENEAQAGALYVAGQRVLRLFFEHWSEKRYDHRQRLIERNFRFSLHGLTISGKIDRLDIFDDGAIIVDYKGRKDPEHILVSNPQFTLYQMAYQLALKKKIKGYPPIQSIQVYNYYSGLTKEIQLRSPNDVARLLTQLLETQAYIKGVLIGKMPQKSAISEFRIYNAQDILRGDFCPKLPRGQHCKWCAYSEQCFKWEKGELLPARKIFAKKHKREIALWQPSQLILPLKEHPLVLQLNDDYKQRINECLSEQLCLSFLE